MIASPELCERVNELDAIDAALDAARAGTGRLVVFQGPAGIGKSSLVDVARGAAHPDVRVHAARATELEREFPFGVALQLFERAVAHDAGDPPLLRGAAGLAGPLFGGSRGNAELPDDDGFSLIHGLYWVAVNLSESGPILLTIDDLQWADAMSLRFLLYLAERIEGTQVAAVVTMRRDEPGAAEDLLARLANNRSAHAFTVQSLTRSAVHDVAARSFSGEVAPEFVAALHDVTDGNPLLVREYANALRAGDVRPDASGADAVRTAAPQSLVERLGERVSLLPSDARALSDALAVLGDEVSEEHLRELTGLTAAEAEEAASILVRAGLARRCEAGGLGWSHPVVRAAAYAQISARDRDALHDRAAHTLLRSGAGLERVAGHFLETRPRGDSSVVEVLWPAATRALANGAPTSALKYLRRGLAEPPAADILPEFLVDLGLAETALGEPAALEHLEDALRHTPSRGKRAEILYRIGRSHRAHGRIVEASEVFAQGLKCVPEFRPQLEVELECAYLSVARFRRDGRDEIRRRLVHLTDRLAATSTASRAALAEVAFEQAITGAPKDEVVQPASAALAGDLARLEEAGPAEIALTRAATALIWVDEFTAAEAALSAALDQARTRGSIMSVATLGYRRALGRLATGDLTGALADAQEATDAARYGWRLFLPAAHAVLGIVLAERGEIHRAGLALDPAIEQPSEHAASRATFLDARGRLRLVLGDPDAALKDFEQAGEFLQEAGVQNPAVAAWRSGAAVALAQLGAPRRATQLASEELADARKVGAPRAIGVALRALGLSTGGDTRLDALHESVEALEPSGAVLERARSEVELGIALRRAGQRAAAVDHLRVGRALATQHGAVLLDDQARQELLAAGAKPRRTAVSGPGSLTPSELRVASMAAESLTNREIAQRLFVSIKAVEWHLRNAYSKLGIRSRQELAATLATRRDPQ